MGFDVISLRCYLRKEISHMKDAIQGIADRISGPLYGYVSVSLVLFNWKWLALLFMSNYPVEVRIAVIQEYFSWWFGLVIPFVSGTATALVTPYIHFALSLAHREAVKKSLSVQIKMAKDKADADQEIARHNAKIAMAQSMANDCEALKQKRLQALAVRVETKINEMRDDAHALKIHHDENIGKFRELNNEVSMSISMLETIYKTAAFFQETLPKDEDLERLIKERSEFLKNWKMKYGDNIKSPPDLNLNTAGFGPRKISSAE